MANRYWGGGTGGWNTTNTANWYSDLARTTLAGAVPTAADDVFFDNLSNATLYACTLTTTPVCRSLSISGPASGNVTIAGSGSVALAISGSLAIASTGVTCTHTGTITFNATTTGWTISAGVSLASPITFNGVGGGWTLTAGLTTTGGLGGLTVSAGTFDTGANFGISCNLFTVTSASARTVNLNASTVNCSSIASNTITNLTFNAGTSTFIASGTSFTDFSPTTALTLYNLTLTSTTFSTISLRNLTFNNLTLPAKSAAGVATIILVTNITVNGLLTCTASTTLGSSRYFVKSSVYGTTRTLTAATVNLTDVDFQDITGAGTASWTGTRLGNTGGNSGITFTTGVAKYWNLVTGGAITGLGWALSSGGTPSAANFPLPQDTMTFVNTGLNTSASITLGSAYNFGGIDCSARTLAMTLATAANTMYGSIALSTAVTMSGAAVLTFQNRGAITITSAGRTFTQAITFNGIGGTYTLDGAWTVNGAVILTYGTLSLDTYTFTGASISLSGSTVRALDFGTAGIITCTSRTNSLVAIGVTNLTIIGTSDFRLTYNGALSSSIFPSNAATFLPNIKVMAGTYALTIDTSDYVGNLDFTGYAGACAFSPGNIYGNLLLSTGMTATGMSLTFGETANQTITSNTKTLGAITVTKTGAGVLSLVDDLALTLNVNMTSGTFDASNKNILANGMVSSGTVARTLTMGSGTWTLFGTSTMWNLTTPTGMTLNANTSTINLTNTTTTTRTFAGGGLTYNNLVIGGATGISTLQFTGSNTFNTISSTKTVAHTLSFTAGTTTTVADWTVTGTVGNVVTIGSATAASHNLVKTGGGNISVDYMSISRSNASP
jgi:hypothetical protein